MAQAKHTDRLVLLHRDGSYTTESAPPDFDWQAYPRELTLDARRDDRDVLEGTRWVYIGTLDGRPHYREVSE